MASKPTYKELVDQVKHRFDGKYDDAAPREHYNITTSRLQENAQEGTLGRIRTVTDASKSIHNAKEKKISNQVRKMLIKSKAEGNSNLAEADRLYIMVNFTETQTSKCVFVPAFQTVGNVLESLATRYTREAFGTATRPDGVTLQCCFPHDEERAHWLPKGTRVDSMLEQGAEVDAFIRSVSDEPPTINLVDQPRHSQDDVKDDQGAAAEAETLDQALEADTKKARTEDSSASVAADVKADLVEASEGFTVHISQGKTVHPVSGITPNMTVAELKELVVQATGVPVSRQKLVFRGVLQDRDRIGSTSIKPNCKITLMTTGKW